MLAPDNQFTRVTSTLKISCYNSVMACGQMLDVVPLTGLLKEARAPVDIDCDYLFDLGIILESEDICGWIRVDLNT